MQSSDSEDEIFFGPVVSNKEQKKINRLKGRKTIVLDPKIVAAQLTGKEAPNLDLRDCHTQDEDVIKTQTVAALEQEEVQSSSGCAPTSASSSESFCVHDHGEPSANLVEKSQHSNLLSSRNEFQSFELCSSDKMNASEEDVENFPGANTHTMSEFNYSSLSAPDSSGLVGDVSYGNDHLVCREMREGSSVDLMSEECHGLSPLKLALPSTSFEKYLRKEVAINDLSERSRKSLEDAELLCNLNESVKMPAQACVPIDNDYSDKPNGSCDNTVDNVKQVDGSVVEEVILRNEIDSQMISMNNQSAVADASHATSHILLETENSSIAVTESNASAAETEKANEGDFGTTKASHNIAVENDKALDHSTLDGIAMETAGHVNQVESNSSMRSYDQSDTDVDLVKSSILPASSEKSAYFSVDQERTSTETMEYFSAQCNPDTDSSSVEVVSECHQGASAAVGPSFSTVDSSITCSSAADVCEVSSLGVTPRELPEETTGGSFNYNYLSDKFSIISIDEKDVTDHSSSPAREVIVLDNVDAEFNIAVHQNGELQKDIVAAEFSKFAVHKNSPPEEEIYSDQEMRDENFVDADNVLKNAVIDEGFHDTGDACSVPDSHNDELRQKDPVFTTFESDKLCAVTPPPSIGYKHLFSAVALTAAEIVTPPPPQPTQSSVQSSICMPVTKETSCSRAIEDINSSYGELTDAGLISNTEDQLGSLKLTDSRLVGRNNDSVNIDTDNLSLSLLADVAIADEKRASCGAGFTENSVGSSYELRSETAASCDIPVAPGRCITSTQSSLPPTPIQNQFYASTKTTPRILGVSPSTTPGGSVGPSPAREKFLAFARELKAGRISDTSPFKAIVSVPGRSAIRNINKELDLLECQSLSTGQNDFSSDPKVEDFENAQSSDGCDDVKACVDASEVTLAGLDLEREAKRVISSLDGQNTRPRESFFSALEVIDVHKPDIYGTFMTDAEHLKEEPEPQKLERADAPSTSGNENPSLHNCSLSSGAMHNEDVNSSMFDHENSFESQAQAEYSSAYPVNEDMMQFNDTLERMDYLLKASQEYNQNLLKQQHSPELEASNLDRSQTADSGAFNTNSSNDAVNQAASNAGNQTASGTGNQTASDAGNQTAAEAGNQTAAEAGNQTAAEAGNQTASDAGNQTASDAGTLSSSSDEAPANIAINELSSTSDGNGGDVKRETSEDASIMSELSLLSFKKHSLNSQISISSFAPMLDSTHASCLPRGDEQIETSPKSGSYKAMSRSAEQPKRTDECSTSSSLEQRVKSKNSIEISSSNSSSVQKTPAKPPRLAHGRDVKPVAIVSPSVNASPSNSQRPSEKAHLPPRYLLKNSSGTNTPCSKNNFKSPISTPRITAASSSVVRLKQASASTLVVPACTRTPASSSAYRTPASSSAYRTPASSSASRTPASNSASRLPVTKTPRSLTTPWKSREAENARKLSPNPPGSARFASSAKRLPATPCTRGIKPQTSHISSTPSRHVVKSTPSSTPQGPVARALQKNPPPALFTNVKPKCSIGPHLKQDASDKSHTPASANAAPSLGVDLNDSMQQRSLALNRIQKTLDQLRAKSPGGGKTSPASASAQRVPPSPSAASTRTALPHVQYTHAPTLLLGNKENVTPRRPCCKGKAEAAAAEPKLQVLKHSGRVLVPKNESEDGSLMEMSVHERRSILHTNTIASKK